VKVTVTLGSARPGGLDVTMAGLCAQTYEDFEVVFVDARYYERHTQVLDLVARSGFTRPFFHVPNHRYQPFPWGTTCAGYNTGFMLADGDLVVMLLDYAYAPPGWLEAHVAAHEGKKRLVLAPHDYHHIPEVVTKDGEPALTKERATGMTPEAIASQKTRYDEIAIFREPFDPKCFELGHRHVYPHVDPKMALPEGPVTPEYFHTKNESFPLENVLAVNGMDEHYDRMGGPGDPEISFRLVRTGLEPWCYPPAVVRVLCPRDVMPNPNAASFYDKRMDPPHDWRGSYMEGHRYYEASKAEGRLRARNPYELRKKRNQIWWWRMASQERHCAIPYNEVGDREYFGGSL
jgi:glycosyltransferase involved in cell wall biosynthesis